MEEEHQVTQSPVQKFASCLSDPHFLPLLSAWRACFFVCWFVSASLDALNGGKGEEGRPPLEHSLLKKRPCVAVQEQPAPSSANAISPRWSFSIASLEPDNASIYLYLSMDRHASLCSPSSALDFPFLHASICGIFQQHQQLPSVCLFSKGKKRKYRSIHLVVGIDIYLPALSLSLSISP